MGSIPGSGRSSGEGYGNPIQYPGLENPMDKRSLAGHSVTKNRTQLKWLSMAWAPKLGRAIGSLSLLIQKLISSSNTLIDIPRIMSEKPMAQPSWHIKVTICTTLQTC